MVKIRLTRKGAKKRPFYRVIVTDSRTKRDGTFLENIGTYDPLQNPSAINIDADRAKYWIGCGAQPSSTVKKLLKISGL